VGEIRFNAWHALQGSLRCRDILMRSTVIITSLKFIDQLLLAQLLGRTIDRLHYTEEHFIFQETVKRNYTLYT